MTRAGIEQLLYLMDQSFEGNDDHSLLSNLRSVRDDDWTWLPAGGGRSIFEHVQHIGECKYVYENHAFGDGSMHWTKPATVPRAARCPPNFSSPSHIVDSLSELLFFPSSGRKRECSR